MTKLVKPCKVTMKLNQLVCPLAPAIAGRRRGQTPSSLNQNTGMRFHAMKSSPRFGGFYQNQSSHALRGVTKTTRKQSCMKTKLIFTSLFLAAVLSVNVGVHAQGTVTYLSGLSEPTAGSLPVGSDAWIATWFQTGQEPLGYRLESIQLLMDQPVGNPSGFTIMLWDFRAAQPITTLAGPDPSAPGTFTYHASSFSLAPSTVYWFVVTAQAPVATGAYQWSYSNVNSVQQNRWRTGGYQTSTDGLVWSRDAGGTFQFAINATAIPEPSALALVLCGGALWLAARGRRRTG